MQRPSISKLQIDVSHEQTMSLLEERAKSGTIPFARATMPGYRINWHHRVMGRNLDLFIDKKIPKLMVMMPPRVGKSELTSRRAPSLILGKYPDSRIISATYGHALSMRMNRDVQRIMETQRYRTLFPGTRLANSGADGSKGYARTTSFFEVVGHTGTYRSTAVKGPITGEGADYLMIDDPHKNQQEAESETIRESIWEWYQSTALPRLEKDGSVLLTMTRWHEDDLAGRILEQEADEWVVISFPAIKERDSANWDPRKIGDALWPWKYDLNSLAKIRKSVGSKVWRSLYQQEPTPEDGTVIKRAWWKFYNVKPSEFDLVICSWDLTFKEGKSNDYVVGQIWGRIGSDKYLLDQFRGQIGFTETLQRFTSLAAKYPDCGAKLVEEAANGAALIDTLKKKVSGILPIRPRGSKLIRAQAVSPQIEAGNVFLPDPSIAPWIHDYLEEWASFPSGRNDDQVDATTQALSHLASTEFHDMDIVSITGESYWNG